MKNKSFFLSFFTNSMGILVSRILGFIRDLLTAYVLGASIYSDIFFIAFKLPNLFRRIFAEGAFSQAFLPSFTKAKNKGVFSFKILVKFSFLLIILCIIVSLFSPFVTKLIAFGFTNEIISLASPLVAINFWYLLLIFLVTFLGSLLYYKNHFATTSFSTALLNVAMIFMLLMANKTKPLDAVYLLSFGVILGGILQVMIHIYVIKKYNFHVLLYLGAKYRHKEEKTKFFNQFFHASIGTSAAQFSAFIDTWLASFLATGSISYLYYSNRVFQLPLALFAIALSISIFPKITKSIKKNKQNEAKNILKKSTQTLLFLLLSSTLGGIILSHEITILLFQRGEFNEISAKNTAFVLQMYLIGLVPFGLSKIFSLWLYANEKQKKAAMITFVSLSFNIIFSLLLISPLKAGGLALASSLSGFVLLFLTIKTFGIRDFLDIILDFKMLYLIIFLIIEYFVLMQFKGFVSVYI